MSQFGDLSIGDFPSDHIVTQESGPGASATV